MSRLATLTLRLAALLLLVFGASLVNRQTTRALASAPAFTYTVTLSPQARCDGDSVTLTVRAINADGTPAAGVSFSLVAVREGDQVAQRRGGERTTQVTGATNARGVFHAYIIPAAGTRAQYYFALGVLGGSPHLLVGACPFADDRSVVVDATMFSDTNGDGVQGARERRIESGQLAIYGGCYGPGCFYPLHYTGAGRHGVFEWTGLIQYPQRTGDPLPFPAWNVCVPEDRRTRTVTSINGTPVDPASVAHLTQLIGVVVSPVACVYLGPLQPGVNTFKIGVQ